MCRKLFSLSNFTATSLPLSFLCHLLGWQVVSQIQTISSRKPAPVDGFPGLEIYLKSLVFLRLASKKDAWNVPSPLLPGASFSMAPPSSLDNPDSVEVSISFPSPFPPFTFSPLLGRFLPGNKRLVPSSPLRAILLSCSPSDWPRYGAEPRWRHSKEELGSGCWAEGFYSRRAAVAANSLGSYTGGCSFSPLKVSAPGERRAVGGAGLARGCGCGRWAAAPQPNCQRAWRYWKGLGRVAGPLAGKPCDFCTVRG